MLAWLKAFVKKIKAEHPRDMKIISTGGLSTLFKRGTNVIDHIDLDLTLHGLYLIDQTNRK